MRQQKRSAPRGAVRTHRFSGGLRRRSARAAARARRAAARRPSGRRPGSARGDGAGRACSWNGWREAYGHHSTASSSIATIRSRWRTSSCDEVLEQVAAHRARRVGAEALALAGHRGGHEVQRVAARRACAERRALAAARRRETCTYARVRRARASARATARPPRLHLLGGQLGERDDRLRRVDDQLVAAARGDAR